MGLSRLQRNRGGLVVVVNDFGIDLDLDADSEGELIHGVVEMCSVDHPIGRVKVSLKLRDELGESDHLSVLPPAESDVLWRNDFG